MQKLFYCSPNKLAELEFSFAVLAISANIFALSVPNSILPLSDIDASIWIDLTSIPTCEAIFKLTLIQILIMPNSSPNAVHLSIFVQLTKVVLFVRETALIDKL